MIPKQSYIVWSSQRTGSTLLTAALAETGVAGRPSEALNDRDPAALTLAGLHGLWQEGSTPNGVFGLKYGPRRDSFAAWTEALRRVLELPGDLSVPEVWAATFPNSRYVFMTRRDKVRLAVSWWRAIQSGEWHRLNRQAPANADLEDCYSFEAIDHLLAECSLREALIGEFFDQAGILPLTVVYEDFICDYEGMVRRVLSFLGRDVPDILPAPAFEQIADGLAEVWVRRFRHERQVPGVVERWPGGRSAILSG